MSLKFQAGWFNIYKLINIINHKKDFDMAYTIISIDVEKAFNNPVCFHNKCPGENWMGGNKSQPNQGNLRQTHFLSGGKNEAL